MALGAVALGAGVAVGARVVVCAAACEHSTRRHAALAAQVWGPEVLRAARMAACSYIVRAGVLRRLYSKGVLW